MSALEWNLLQSALEKIDRARTTRSGEAVERLMDLERVVRRLLRAPAPPPAAGVLIDGTARP